MEQIDSPLSKHQVPISLTTNDITIKLGLITKKCIATHIPYSTKLWREKTLADLAVHCQSAKVLSAKTL